MPIRSALLLFLGLFSLSYLSWGDDDLQRLFTTAKQRVELNEARKKPKSLTETQTGALKPPPYITFNGLVTRTTGPTTIWLNNDNGLFQQGFTVAAEQRQGLAVPIRLSNQKVITLKPGQTLNTLNGEIQENFERGPNNYE